MKIERSRLYEIILEEHLKQEGMLQELTDQQKEEMLDWIRGKGPRPDWATDDYGQSGAGKAVQSPNDSDVDRAADTMPFPAGDSRPDDAPLEDQIMNLVQGLAPEEVADLFQAVFEKIPGVEMGQPEEEPETLYSPGAEGRPTISLGPVREHLAAKTLEKLLEIAGLSYGTHSIAGVPGNRDDDPDYESMQDSQLIDMAERDGIEEILIVDVEGDLVNRREVIAALKDV